MNQETKLKSGSSSPSSALLACPFCDSRAIIQEQTGTPVWLFGRRYWVECSYERCPVMMMTGRFDKKEDCIKAWNTRAAGQANDAGEPRRNNQQP